MIKSKHLAVGLALSFGLIGCGQASKKDGGDNPQALPNASLARAVESNVTGSEENQAFKILPSEQRVQLQQDVNDILSKLVQTRSRMEEIQNEIMNNPERETELKPQYDELANTMQTFQMDYAEKRDQLAQDDSYRDLYQLTQDQGITKFGDISSGLDQKAAQLSQEVDRLQAKEAPLAEQLSQAETGFQTAVQNFTAQEDQLKNRSESLKSQPSLTPEESTELTAIDQFLDASREWQDLQSQLMQEQTALVEHKKELSQVMQNRIKAEIQEFQLKNELDKLPQEDSERRQDLMNQIDQVQQQLVQFDQDSMVHVDAAQTSTQSIASVQQSIETLQPRLKELQSQVQQGMQSIAGDSIDQVQQTGEALLNLRQQQSQWLDEVSTAQNQLASVDKLKLFAADKFGEMQDQPISAATEDVSTTQPDVSGTETGAEGQTQPVQAIGSEQQVSPEVTTPSPQDQQSTAQTSPQSGQDVSVQTSPQGGQDVSAQTSPQSGQDVSAQTSPQSEQVSTAPQSEQPTSETSTQLQQTGNQTEASPSSQQSQEQLSPSKTTTISDTAASVSESAPVTDVQSQVEALPSSNVTLPTASEETQPGSQSNPTKTLNPSSSDTQQLPQSSTTESAASSQTEMDNQTAS